MHKTETERVKNEVDWKDGKIEEKLRREKEWKISKITQFQGMENIFLLSREISNFLAARCLKDKIL